MARKKGTKNKSKLLPSDRPELLEKQIEQNQLENPVYKLTLKSLGRTFNSEGTTLEEALRKIKISGGAKGMSVVTIVRGDRTKERILNNSYTHNLFSEAGPTMKDYAIRKVIELIGL